MTADKVQIGAIGVSGATTLHVCALPSAWTAKPIVRCVVLSVTGHLIDMLVSHDEQISRFRHRLWGEETNHITRAH